ncbi:helix-turn-helix transcriptional regulator [Desertivirga xinjiangensis]|uniref:helix-turn-helix transcriptional regulator n=1 Tax=Desertivirga xinjiangensis TaxID=539206 RepID=UPI002109B15E|nr:helix-turn-helix transcriptional regulator [Pedobacter xinjiangensis]
MQYKEILPVPALRQFIDCYWVLKNNDKETYRNRILPDGCVDIIFNFGESCKVENHTLQHSNTYLVGAMTSYQISYISPNADLIGIRFKPFGFNCLHNFCSLHEITDATIEFDRKLAPDFLKVSKFSYAYLNEYFSAKNISRENLSPLPRIINDIQNKSGRVGVEELIDQCCITARQLERIFKKEVGLTPKKFISIIRNKSAMRELQQRSPGTTLLHIALKYGYYDHSHLCKEIKKFSGQTPSVL